MKKSNPAQNQSMIFVVLFLLGAFVFTIWTMSRIPDNIILHINEEWAIMLVGEKDVNNVKIGNKFTIHKMDKASIHFSGYGKFDWRGKEITIRRGLVSLNGRSISKSRREKVANILFYPDGRLTKGKLQ